MRFDWDRVRAEIEQLAGISQSSEPRLPTWYATARIAASGWLANDWVTDDGIDVEKTADEVASLLHALAEGVRAQYERRTQTAGLTSVTTGPTSETYGGGSSAIAIAMSAMTPILYPLRLSIELL